MFGHKQQRILALVERTQEMQAQADEHRAVLADLQARLNASLTETARLRADARTLLEESRRSRASQPLGDTPQPETL